MATLQQRDKMRSDGRKQFNLWLDGDTADRLKRLSEQTSKPYPALISAALVLLESGAEQGQATSDLEARLLTLEESMKALESRLSAFADRAGSLSASDDKPAEIASEVVSDVPAELAALMIGKVKLEELTDKENGERNRRIIAMHLKGTNTSAISKALQDARIERSGEGSVRSFLKVRGITPNKA